MGCCIVDGLKQLTDIDSSISRIEDAILYVLEKADIHSKIYVDGLNNDLDTLLKTKLEVITLDEIMVAIAINRLVNKGKVKLLVEGNKGFIDGKQYLKLRTILKLSSKD